MRLRKEPGQPWETMYTLLNGEGRVLGMVRKETSHVARHVKGVGGVTRWVGTLPSGEVVTPSNTYRRVDAVDALVDRYNAILRSGKLS